MAGKFEKHFLALAGIVAFTGFVVPTMFSDRKTDTWVTYIYDYQGLLTGILAVGAAYVTVRQMKETDELQEKRHGDMLRLSIHPNRLLVHRAARPNTKLLRAAIKRTIELINEEQLASEPTPEYVDDVVAVFMTIVEIAKSDEIEKARALFEPALNQRTAFLQSHASDLNSSRKLLEKSYTTTHQTDGTLNHRWRIANGPEYVVEVLQDIRETVYAIDSNGREFAELLDELAAFYDKYTFK